LLVGDRLRALEGVDQVLAQGVLVVILVCRDNLLVVVLMYLLYREVQGGPQVLLVLLVLRVQQGLQGLTYLVIQT
jgi:hypothetical protein